MGGGHYISGVADVMMTWGIGRAGTLAAVRQIHYHAIARIDMLERVRLKMEGRYNGI